MTEIDLLKRVRDDVPAPDPLALARARRRLLTPPPARPHASRPRLLLAGALAVTLAGGFLAADVVSRDSSPSPGTVADAGTFLSDAAGLTNANPDAPIPPGQFRQIIVNEGRVVPLGADPSLRATMHSREETWVPANQDTRFVQRIDHLSKVDFASPAARDIARKEARYLFTPSRPNVGLSNCPGIPDGGWIVATVPPTPRCQSTWENPSLAFLARQPRNPDQLFAKLRKGARKQMEPDVLAFRRISAVLDTGLVPADLRAALYEAARKVPGIQLLDDLVTIDGRPARAIARTVDGYRYDLLISPSNGQYLGSRIFITHDGPPDINGDPTRAFLRDDTYSWTSVTSHLTNTQPSPR